MNYDSEMAEDLPEVVDVDQEQAWAHEYAEAMQGYDGRDEEVYCDEE